MHKFNWMKSIHIPNPCSENWESMSPQEKGRFCSVCNKCVIDFTQKQPHEVQQIIEAKLDEPICGRFYDDQLSHKDERSLKVKEKFFRYIPSSFQNSTITLFILSFILFLAGCSKPKESCATTGVVAVDMEYDTIKNKNFVVGEAVIQDDSVAKMSKKDSIHLKKEKHKK
jgi:hypothetical protein